MLEGLIGFAIGAIVIGVIANRRPQWFASIVTMANKIDDKVNAGVTSIVEKVQNK